MPRNLIRIPRLQALVSECFSIYKATGLVRVNPFPSPDIRARDQVGARPADYNGHWGVREICDICPAAQQQRCAGDYRELAPADMDRVLSQLGYETPYLIEDGHVWTHGLGEQRRYAVQHTLRYQIWELDQPHYLHRHGRAPHGY